jgi:aryl-alcohol dehydrogenase
MTAVSQMPMQKIRAAVLRRAGGPLMMEDLVLENPRPGEILVRIVATGICHTDIGMMDWGASGEPVVLGHEGAGVVEKTGGRVKSVRPGDHVVLSYQSCGRCAPCKKGSPADCTHFYDLNFGFHRLDGSNGLAASGVAGHFFGQSSFATYCLATERNVVKVPKNLPLEILAPLGCGMQTGAGTVFNSLAVKKGASIVVFGTGSVGMAAVMAAKIAGAATIIGVDIVPKRLRLARELGATHAIDSRRANVAVRIAKIARGGVDHTVEGTGDPTLMRLATDCLKPGGTAAFLTGASGPDHLPGGRKALSVIQGDAVPQRFIPRLIKLYREGLFPFDRLITPYAFDRINRAIIDAERGVTIKPVLIIGKAQAAPERHKRKR